MKTFITRTIAFLAMLTCISCGKALLFSGEDSLNGAKGNLIVTGTVSSLLDDAPIEGIEVTLTAFGQKGQTELAKDSCTSDHEGVFILTLSDINDKVTCIIKTSDRDSNYESAERTIIISWSDTSFDQKTSTFIVNDCNFKLNINPDII